MALPRFPLTGRLSGWPRRMAAISCLLLAVTSFAGERAAAARARHDAVLVAARDLPAGTALTATDVLAQPWPAGRAPATALHTSGDVAGRTVAGPIAKGEAVTANRLVGRELTRGLGSGYVAVSVQVGVDVLSFVHTGDRVDLVAPGQSPGVDGATERGSPTVHPVTLASAVRVLAAVPASGTGPDAAAGLVVVTDRETAAALAASRGEQLVALLAG